MPSELQTAFSASQLQRERTQTVIPAKNRKSKKNLKSVIPAQAGIQSVRFPFFFEFQVTSKPPFPQKRESRNSKLQEFIKND
ncbi:TPA: hypothetical protein ACLAVK_001902 [Neisseria meningitidis]|nr:hypothetical protein [Neisseria meningitidis]